LAIPLQPHRRDKETDMKTAVLCGIALVCSSAAFAQTPPASAADAPKTITLTGCVGGGTNAQPITLANAMVIPSADAAGAAAPSSSPLLDPVSRPETQPPSAVGRSAAAGTAGANAPAPTPATTPSAVGTSGTITGTAPAGSSTSSISGYRLSGADITPWVGRRVQIVGTLVPAAARASSGGTAASKPLAGAIAMPEFRVVSIQPITGSCSEK
jgi:hypothetical protein